MEAFLNNDFFTRIYYHNTVLDYLIALGIVFFGILIVKLFRRTILRRIRDWAQNTHNRLDDFVLESIDKFGIPWLYTVIVYVGIHYLTLSPKVQNVLKIAFTVVFTFLFIRLLANVIMKVLESYLRKREHGAEKVKQLGGIMLIINAVIWIIGLLFLFDNMGYDVTTVVTGLGIGGIAIALAAQNILGDLFNYFVIFFDRPFETGDYIVVDEKSGDVEYIGIKTTRLKSLTGEQLVFANSDLTASRIHNYKRMQTRRISFKIGVVYDTTLENLKNIPHIIKSIIEEQDKTRFDRAHFTTYNDSSLDFDVVYHVLSSEYNVYMDIQQNINLRIFEEFQKAKIDFAFPTRTVVFTPPLPAPENETEGFSLR